MGLFPDENINWYQKLAVMIRNRLLASAGQLLQLWRAWPISLGCHAHQHCGCALPLRLSICCQRLCKESQSHQHDSKKNIDIFIPKKPPKKLLKIGRGKGLPRPALSWWWLTDWGPRVSKWWWVWILTQIDTGSVFPQGWITPTTKPPLSPSGVGARVHRTHQEAFTVFVVICEITSISMLLPGTCNPPFKNDSSASRKDTLLHLILSLYSQASATQMDTISGIHPPLQDTSFFTFYIYAIITCPPPSKYTILQNLCNPWYHSS